MGGGPSIIQGGQSDAEMRAHLERQADENDRMLRQAASQTAELQAKLEKQDAEMTQLMEQQARTQEINLGKAQKALDAELDAIQDSQSEDDIKADFDLLQDALAKGMGFGGGDTIRPL